MKVSKKSATGPPKSLFSANTCIDGFIGIGLDEFIRTGLEYAMFVYVSVFFLSLWSGFSAAFLLISKI